ncbi:MAG: GAF domain-containing protein [Oscillospiraceae bacterium]|nr:GAF domain-containing protein [Oscillospiraceae bacterium]
MVFLTNYEALLAYLRQRTENIPYETANLANAAALLWEFLPQINWVGFYKMVDGQLVLGPFQGKAARVVIPVGKGVCGTAVAEDKTQRVENVHNFCGHIACDCASNSEIVVPIHVRGEIWGVLDMDSPVFDRFSEQDQKELEQFVKELEKIL